jgi:hypothetical protein
MLALTAGILTWARDPEGTQRTAQAVALVIASAFFGLLYTHSIATVVKRGQRFRFGVRDLLFLTVAVAAFSVTGFALDALVLGALIAYAVAFGPFWKRLVSRVTGMSGAAITCIASGTILSSYVALATVLAVGLVQIEWSKSVPFPMTLLLSLWTSAMFAWVFILGDNARNEMQLVWYGLPVGIPANVILAFICGAILGWLAVVFDRTPRQQVRHDATERVG